jgi:SAM-dependent methyltransferase
LRIVKVIDHGWMRAERRPASPQFHAHQPCHHFASRHPHSAFRASRSCNRSPTPMFTPPRLTSDELLDEHDAPHEAMRRSLRDLRRFNSLAGGTSAFLRLLRPVVRELPAHFSVLDLGTGTSDLIEATRRRWPASSATGLDRNVRHLSYGRELGRGGLHRVAGDAFHLPFRDDSFDVVASSHFFHHFSPDENVNLLTESLRVARHCVMVTDTRRHLAPLLFVRLLGALRLVGEITRFDAPASVLQGYTIPEVEAVVRRVPARRHELRRVIPFRFGLHLWK